MGLKECLTLSDRIAIEQGIYNKDTKRKIAISISKSESTIGKEIKLHRIQKYYCHLGRECANYRTCKHSRKCISSCPDFKQFVCKRRDTSPGACNGCSDYSRCHFNKFCYYAKIAQSDFEKLLHSSREGINKTEEEMNKISATVVPLLLQNQSPYMIVVKHPELGISEKTLYTYIINGFFKKDGVSVMDLRRYVSRKMAKKVKLQYKKRKDRSYIINRTWDDFQKYSESNHSLKILQMDTVYNDVTNGPFLLTLKFIQFGFMFVVFLTSKTDQAVIEGFTYFCNIIGDDLFKKYIDVVTPDRGSEFSSPKAIETTADGTERCKVFYCDPMASWQKGSLENNHEAIRYFVPKQSDMRKLGLINQDKTNLMIQHINSSPKEKLNGKSPIELMKFLAPDLCEKFESYGISQLPSDKIVLNSTIFNTK